jgi:hypothetical protein
VNSTLWPQSMNSFRRFAIILIVLSLLGCGKPNIIRMFKLHVIDPIPASVTEIKYQQGNLGMHSPLFFNFKVSQDDFRMILAHQKTTPFSQMPWHLEMINDRIQKDIVWWKTSEELNKMKIFGRFLQPKDNVGDSVSRIFYVDGSNVYFMTSGFLNRKESEYLPKTEIDLAGSTNQSSGRMP